MEQTQEGQLGADSFENYEIQRGDLETLAHDIDALAESELLEEGILDELRFVTYDSQYLYVFTRGEHRSNEAFTVEELPNRSKTGFRTFKIPNPGTYGKKTEDYRGARASLYCDELESTAVDKPEGSALPVVSMAPFGPYQKLQKKGSNYITDVVFHEAGHIEHGDFEAGHRGEADPPFPTEEQKMKFLSAIQSSKLFPEWMKAKLIKKMSEEEPREEEMEYGYEETIFGTICEMYAMLIDREGKKRYDVVGFTREDTKFSSMMQDLWIDPPDPEELGKFEASLRWAHPIARLLVRVLEEQFPDFKERKKFLRSVLDRSKQRL